MKKVILLSFHKGEFRDTRRRASFELQTEAANKPLRCSPVLSPAYDIQFAQPWPKAKLFDEKALRSWSFFAYKHNFYYLIPYD